MAAIRHLAAELGCPVSEARLHAAVHARRAQLAVVVQRCLPSLGTIAELRVKWRVGIVAKVDVAMVKVLERAGLPALVDTASLSARLGTVDDRTLLRHAAARLRTPADRVVFMSAHADERRVAEDLGMRTMSVSGASADRSALANAVRDIQAEAAEPRSPSAV